MAIWRFILLCTLVQLIKCDRIECFSYKIPNSTVSMLPGNCYQFCNTTSARDLTISKVEISLEDYKDLSEGMIQYRFYSKFNGNPLQFLNLTVNQTLLDGVQRIPIPFEAVNKFEICYTSWTGIPRKTHYALVFKYLKDSELAVIISVTIISGFVFVFVVICLILICIFTRKQPLRSRGGLPIMHSILFLIKIVIAQALNWYGQSTAYQMVCLYILIVLLQVFTQFGLTLNHIRYLILERMTRTQIFLHDSPNQCSSMFIRTLRIANSIWFVLAFLAIIFITVVIVPWAVWVSKFGCLVNEMVAPETRSAVFIYIAAIFGVFLFNCTLYVLILAFDWVKDRRGLKDFFITLDPHYFRMEFVFYMLAPLIFLVFVGGVILVATIWMLFDQSSDEFLFLIPAAILIPDVYYYIFMGIFPLALTIVIHFKKKLSPKVGALEKMLTNDELRDLFKKQCEVEFSVENILCYDEIQHFKHVTECTLAEKIVNQYLLPKAPIEVNVRQPVVNIIRDAIKNNKITPAMFDDIEKDLIANMSDTYSRFITVESYRTYHRKQEMIEKV